MDKSPNGITDQDREVYQAHLEAEFPDTVWDPHKAEYIARAKGVKEYSDAAAKARRIAAIAEVAGDLYEELRGGGITAKMEADFRYRSAEDSDKTAAKFMSEAEARWDEIHNY